MELAEGIQNFSTSKKDRLYEFANKLLVEAENEPQKQGEDKLSFEKIILYFYAKEKLPAEQEKELIEPSVFLRLLDESGAGILCYTPVYSWYYTFKGKKHTLQVLQREWYGFVDIEGNYEDDLDKISEEKLRNIFLQNPECEGKMGFAVEIFDVDALKEFMQKFEELLHPKFLKRNNENIRVDRIKKSILMNNSVVHEFKGDDSHPWRIFIKAYDDPKGKISLDSRDIEDIPNKKAVMHNLNKRFITKGIPMKFTQFEGKKNIYRLIK